MTPPRQPLSELKRELARYAELVCARYLSAGSKSGSYWRVGDIDNTPGRSMFVGLTGPRAGQWTDHSAHGDLLDILVHHEGGFGPACRAARLLMGTTEPPPRSKDQSRTFRAAARRNFEAATPVAGTPAAHYLRGRGLRMALPADAFRFHPELSYRLDKRRFAHYPAFIGAFTGPDGAFLGILRTYLDATRAAKAEVEDPRRTLGRVAGGAIRLGDTRDVIAVGEGVETMLSLRAAFPKLPVAACSGDKLLAQWKPSARHRRVLIALDADPAGEEAGEMLASDLSARGLAVAIARPSGGDFNDDLQALGARGLRRHLAPCLRALCA